MSPDAAVRLSPTVALDPRERAAVRALLDAAFDGDFGDDDWAHALGGVHALITDGPTVVAHAAIVPRDLAVGQTPIRVGYVEAVAVWPDLQGTGLGTAVMRSLGEIIAREFALGALSTGEWHFYQRLGWERWLGRTFVRHADGRRERTPDDDDSVMILRTPASPAVDLSWPIACEARSGDHW